MNFKMLEFHVKMKATKWAWHLSLFMYLVDTRLSLFLSRPTTPIQKIFYELSIFIFIYARNDSMTLYFIRVCVSVFTVDFGMSDDRINLNEKCQFVDSFKMMAHINKAHARAHQCHQKVKSQRNVNCLNDKSHFRRLDVCMCSIYIHLSIKCKWSTKWSKRQ